MKSLEQRACVCWTFDVKITNRNELVPKGFCSVYYQRLHSEAVILHVVKRQALTIILVFIGVGREAFETRAGMGSTNTDDPVFPLLMAGAQRPRLRLSGRVPLADASQECVMIFIFIFFSFSSTKGEFFAPSQRSGISHCSMQHALLWRQDCRPFSLPEDQELFGHVFQQWHIYICQNPLFALGVYCCEEGASCNIHCFFLRLSWHSRDVGIQGRISPLAVEASITCKAPKLLKVSYSQLRLRLTRFLDLWSAAGSTFVGHEFLWRKRGLNTNQQKLQMRAWLDLFF